MKHSQPPCGTLIGALLLNLHRKHPVASQYQENVQQGGIPDAGDVERSPEIGFEQPNCDQMESR